MQHLQQGHQLTLSVQQQCCTASFPQLLRQPQLKRCCLCLVHASVANQQDSDPNGSNEANRRSSTRQQVSRTPPVKDRPDMGARSKRNTKIPFPHLPNTPQPGSIEYPTDADSPGFQERALLAGFLETLDPETRQQFALYMETQLRQLQEQQQQSSAVDFLQDALGKAAYRSMRSPGDVQQYFSSNKAESIMWDTLREQFSKDEVALLDDVLGRDWSSFNSRALDPETVKRISSLTIEQQAVLGNVLAKMSDMTEHMDALEADMQSVAQNNTVTDSTSNKSSSTSSTKTKSDWGASFKTRKADRVNSSRSMAGGSKRSSGKAADPAAAAAAAAGDVSPDQYWDTLLDEGMSDKVQRMMAFAGQACRGQLQWGRPPSRHFTQLQQIYQQMAQVETLQLQQPGQLSQPDVAAAYGNINFQLNELAAQADGIQDTATRSALLYMDALFNTTSSSSSSNDQMHTATHGATPAEALPGANSSSAGELQQQQGDGTTEAAATGMVTLQNLNKLGKFLKAASNLEAYQTLLSVLSEKHPDLASQEVLWLSNLGGDDWFVKPELQDQALAAAQAAAEAFAAVEAAPAAAAAAGSSHGSRGRSVASAISGALLPYIDDARIDALAVFDADTLWFMAELEANDNSDDVIMKWSLHPTVGQKMLGGSWLSDVPEQLRQLYLQVQAPDFMTRLDQRW